MRTYRQFLMATALIGLALVPRTGTAQGTSADRDLYFTYDPARSACLIPNEPGVKGVPGGCHVMVCVAAGDQCACPIALPNGWKQPLTAEQCQQLSESLRPLPPIESNSVAERSRTPGLATQVEPKKSKPDPDAFVVRGGITTPQQLQAGVAEHRAVRGLTGFSVQSAPGKTVEELAAAGQFRNAQISVTTVGTLLKIGVLVVPSPGVGYHNTAITPMPLSDVQAVVISSVFQQRPNPARQR